MKRSPFPLLILIYICLSTTVIWIYQKSKKDSNQSGLKKLSSIAWNDTTSNKSTTLSQVPQLVANGSEKAVTLKNLSIQTKIEGNIATTSYEMQFYNSEKRDLETELNFPLGENQTITRFVMDVNGKLREGVAIEKQKARVAFESTIRKNIDPGLVEMTKGNNFKARVFPVPALGYKKIIIECTQELPSTSKNSIYFLPLGFKDKLASFKLNVNVIKQNLSPKIVSNPSEELKFERVTENYVATLKKKDFIPSKALRLELPNPKAGPITVIKKSGNINYFYTNFRIPTIYKEKVKPNHISVFWDVSASRVSANQKLELKFLRDYLSGLKNVKVELIPFSNVIMKKTDFQIKNGNTSKLEKALSDLIYDGGTQLENLDFNIANGKEILLFTDGISNLGSHQLNASKKRIYVINSSVVTDLGLMTTMAQKTKGEFINLATNDYKKSLNNIKKDQLHFLGFKNEGRNVEFYPKRDYSANASIGIAGKIDSKEKKLTALFGFGNKAEYYETIDLARGKNKKDYLDVEKLFAIKKVDYLSMNYNRHKKQITELGLTYKLVTKNTSLLVLDRVEDYVEHKIVPPKELQKAYFELLAKREKENNKTEKEKLNSLAKEFKEHVKWWNSVGYRKVKNKSEVPNEVQITETHVTGNSEQMAPTPPPVDQTVRFVAPEVVEEVANERSSDEELNREVIRGGTWQDVGYYLSTTGATASATYTLNATDFNYCATGVDQNATYSWSSNVTEHSGKMTVQGWDPKTPYMKIIKKAGLTNAYDCYLQERKKYGTQPSFYLDVADFFIQNKKEELGLRVLSNIAELELENHSLLRILAHRFIQLKATDLGLELFKDLVELRGEEPQSYRDLGLAYEEIGNHEKAVQYLYKVITGEYDVRFNGIGLITLNEINNILFQHENSFDYSYIDKRFIKNLPVDIRVVLNWDADNTDVDLWVTDPNGERCYYMNKKTMAGGKISNDFTQGYGPEEFMIRRAIPGKYKIQAHYYGSSAQTITGKATLSVQLFRKYGHKNCEKQEITRRLNVTKDIIDIGTFHF
jgi:tetratricopeptide (TPR) repeat protein